MKQKTKKISLENCKDDIKVISAGQQKLLTGGGCACCICSPGNGNSGLGGSPKASISH